MWTLAVILSRILMIDLLLIYIALSRIPSGDLLHLHLQAMHGSSKLVAQLLNHSFDYFQLAFAQSLRRSTTFSSSCLTKRLGWKLQWHFWLLHLFILSWIWIIFLHLFNIFDYLLVILLKRYLQIIFRLLHTLLQVRQPFLQLLNVFQIALCFSFEFLFRFFSFAFDVSLDCFLEFVDVFIYFVYFAFYFLIVIEDFGFDFCLNSFDIFIKLGYVAGYFFGKTLKMLFLSCFDFVVFLFLVENDGVKVLLRDYVEETLKLNKVGERKWLGLWTLFLRDREIWFILANLIDIHGIKDFRHLSLEFVVILQKGLIEVFNSFFGL